MKILYFDCYAGISGDMTVGALLDLGVPLSFLKEELAHLPIPPADYALSAEETFRRSIRATKFGVQVIKDQPHRHYSDIAGMIEGSALTDEVKLKAGRIFRRLAEAEAKVHGVELSRVHFHEVGALDSIIDIVGTALCLQYLGIEELYASALPLGSGYVETAHGRLPVPAPATAELLRGLPVHAELGAGERVTPTGAAILAALCSGFGAPPPFTVTEVGSGAGDRDFPDTPNILRIMLGEKTASLPGDEIRVMESHIDDMNPEILGFLMERLLAAGALDVAFSPLQMKKNRPGLRITILSSPALQDTLARMLLTETSAIGVRHYPATRMKLHRALEERDTSLGRVQVKVIRDDANLVRIAPEFEECRRIAEAKGMPLQDVYRIIERETWKP
ncbi:MAG: nickel pincer cofactor biosynthesis protein LarC [Deltaproteobacteria bacterium]|nr:nickel pincer cofactor biosynthesis protein LarC [Deltaproteobacteria bacterium]TLN03948.1 MAG: nickel pincer cofactor biosynthesis protein LarC [bacterium]